MEKTPLCLVGCGGMGHRHILAYKELELNGALLPDEGDFLARLGVADDTHPPLGDEIDIVAAVRAVENQIAISIAFLAANFFESGHRLIGHVLEQGYPSQRTGITTGRRLPRCTRTLWARHHLLPYPPTRGGSLIHGIPKIIKMAWLINYEHHSRISAVVRYVEPLTGFFDCRIAK